MNSSTISKDSILNTCQTIVKEDGLSAINMRSVASKCQVAVGSIYNYFPSKAELISATVESIWKAIFHMEQKELAFSSFSDCLSWLFESIKKGGQDYPGFFSVHSLSFASEEKGSGRQKMEAYFIHIKSHLLATLKTDSKIRKDAFNEILTPALFTDHIFTLFLAALHKPQSHYDGLLEIVNRCLY